MDRIERQGILLIGYGQLMITLAFTCFFIASTFDQFHFEIGAIIAAYITSIIGLFFVFLTYLGWIMPDWYKNWYKVKFQNMRNQPPRELKEVLV